MPGLIEILNMMDEIHSTLDQPTKPSQSTFPVVFLEQHPVTFRRYNHPAIKSNRQFCPLAMRTFINGEVNTKQKQPTEEAKENDFSVAMDVSSFKPEEISVKVKDRDIIIEAKHEERKDEHGFISRQFTRKFVLPDEYDPDTTSTYLNADGKMTVKALKPRKPEAEVKERVIAITRVSEPDSRSDKDEMKKKKEMESTDEEATKEEKSV